jgi:hypothetical protein
MRNYLNFLKLLTCIASLLFALHANGTESIPCKVLDPDIGLSYTGECKDGLAHGIGHAKGRDEYVGSFESGAAHGFGKYTWGEESEWAGQAYEGWHYRGPESASSMTRPTPYLSNGDFFAASTSGCADTAAPAWL